MTDGRVNACKECQKKAYSERRNRHIDEFREKDRLRGMLPHRVAARAEYQKSHKPLVNQIKYNWIKRNPEKRAAHKAVHNAIRRGDLVRLPCVVCGDPKSQAHHSDYEKPLEVTWRCRKHHHRGLF